MASAVAGKKPDQNVQPDRSGSGIFSSKSWEALAKSLGMRAADLEETVRRLVRSRRVSMTERVTATASTGAPRVKIVRLAGDVDAESLSRAPVQARCVCSGYTAIEGLGALLPLRFC